MHVYGNLHSVTRARWHLFPLLLTQICHLSWVKTPSLSLYWWHHGHGNISNSLDEKYYPLCNMSCYTVLSNVVKQATFVDISLILSPSLSTSNLALWLVERHFIWWVTNIVPSKPFSGPDARRWCEGLLKVNKRYCREALYQFIWTMSKENLAVSLGHSVFISHSFTQSVWYYSGA